MYLNIIYALWSLAETPLSFADPTGSGLGRLVTAASKHTEGLVDFSVGDANGYGNEEELDGYKP